MMIMLQESPFSRKGSKGSVIARWEERRVGREGGKKKKPLEWKDFWEVSFSENVGYHSSL